MNAEITPEAFAETIKSLVDEFHVVVPTGSARDQKIAMPLKRRSDSIPQGLNAKRIRQESKPDAPCNEVSHGMRARGVTSKASAMEGGDSSEAWEALVSVCSML